MKNVRVTEYVIITPAKNEESYIEKTIESMLSQTVRPSKWIIVDDASTDRTAEIVNKYSTRYEFIVLLKTEIPGDRGCPKKVAAFNAGLKLLAGTECSLIGNLDADVSFRSDYYEKIIAEFERDPKLGIAGGVLYTKIGSRFTTDDTAADSVAGAVQLFRKECFDQVGGYIPLGRGGVDAAAEIIARMKGWTVKKFPQNKVWEHRRTGSAGNALLPALYKEGVRFHSLGYSTLFYIFRSVYKLKRRPVFIGSAVPLLGFTWAKLNKYPLCLPPEAVSYLRSEQIGKLRRGLLEPIKRFASKENSAQL